MCHNQKWTLCGLGHSGSEAFNWKAGFSDLVMMIQYSVTD